MCSIIASFDKETIKKLVKLNQYRGNFSHSLTIFNNTVKSQVKNFGLFPVKLLDMINVEGGDYIIGHVQAPTGGMVKDVSRIHPTLIEGTQLWHNGIITPRGIKFLQSKLNTTDTFDTKLLHQAVFEFGFDILSEIEGLFACLLIKDNKLFMFRTKHAKLYIDDELSISSERFSGSKCINYDSVYEINLKTKELYIRDTFKTLRFNIVVPGEL
jgi:glutamine phosphoribosylpyrophosphate amidotransferase